MKNHFKKALRAFWYSFLPVRNNLRREHLIDPAIPEELRDAHVNREGGTGRLVEGGNGYNKNMMKSRKGEKAHIRRRILKLPRANFAHYTSHLIMWWGLFWRWLFVCHCDWNNNDGGLVFLLFAQRKRHTGICSCTASDTNTDKVSRRGALTILWS